MPLIAETTGLARRRGQRGASHGSARAPLISSAPFDVELDTSAQHFLDTDKALKDFSEMVQTNPEHWVADAAQFVRKATNKQHLKTLAFVYAIWLRSARNSRFGDFIAALRKLRQRANKHTTDLHLLVEGVMVYGDADQDRQKKRGLYNRDVAAIRYLQHSRIGPSDVEDLASKLGEGLDAWARGWTRIKAQVDPKAPERVHREPKIMMTVHTTAQDGKITIKRYDVSHNHTARALIEELGRPAEDQASRSVQANPTPPL